MSSSFLGKSIEVQLASGGAIKGKIVNIDASSGSLSILRPEGNQVLVTRAEIADLKLLSIETAAPTPAPPVPSKSQFQDPAIILYAQATTKPMEKLSLQPTAPSPLAIPRAPAAMLATTSDTGSAGKIKKPAKTKAKKNGGMLHDVGTSSRTQTEDETDYEIAARSEKKNKKKAQQHRGMINHQSDLDEDFDFDKALKSFDKRKIWQEIKTTDQTDPKMLLVSHNRLNRSNVEADRGRFKGRSAQDKLGLHEPVLSPSPTASHSSLSPEEGNIKLEPKDDTLHQRVDSNKTEAELQRVRGNALQREMENGKLKDEIRKLTEKVRLLEALGGVDLVMQSEDVDGHKWKGVIYESLGAHAESRRSNSKPAQGSLSFLLKTFQGEASRLRYLGVVTEESDPQVTERLPPQYKKEMGLKAESASVFVRRIKEAVQTK